MIFLKTNVKAGQGYIFNPEDKALLLDERTFKTSWVSMSDVREMLILGERIDGLMLQRNGEVIWGTERSKVYCTKNFLVLDAKVTEYSNNITILPSTFSFGYMNPLNGEKIIPEVKEHKKYGIYEIMLYNSTIGTSWFFSKYNFEPLYFDKRYVNRGTPFFITEHDGRFNVSR